MSVFLPSFGGIQKGGIHIPYLPPHCPGNGADLLFFSVVTVSCTQSSQGGGGELCVQSQRCTASVEAGHTDMCMAGSTLEQPALEQEGVLGVCVECCMQGTCIWESVGLRACGFGCCSIEGMSPVLCGSTTC